MGSTLLHRDDWPQHGALVGISCFSSVALFTFMYSPQAMCKCTTISLREPTTADLLLANHVHVCTLGESPLTSSKIEVARIELMSNWASGHLFVQAESKAFFPSHLDGSLIKAYQMAPK